MKINQEEHRKITNKYFKQVLRLKKRLEFLDWLEDEYQDFIKQAKGEYKQR